MKNKMTMAVALAAVLCGSACFARGGHGGGFHRGPVHHHAPVHHHHGSVWGRGGCNFWPGFVGGVVGASIIRPTVVSPVVTTPVVTTPIVTTPVVTTPVVTTPVVSTPVVTTQNVWIEGRYVDQVSANGTIIRVWQPGHYEQRQVAY